MINEISEIGSWRKVRKLGCGGFGEVSLWQNKGTSQQIAVKKCNLLSSASDDKLEERWRREVSLMTNEVRNENIVRGLIVDPPEFLQKLCSNELLPPLIMEFCEKGDLRQLLSRTENVNGLPELEVRNVLKSLRNAIVYLHSLGITHRDIKPENLVIKSVNENNIYKLTDLGYAKYLDSKTIEASHVGTIGYLAPELICDDRCSCTVDYWSFGVISFEIICGCRPFIPHHALVQFVLKVKEKKSEHIAISEDNIGNFTFHTELYQQNHISPHFKVLLEKWLTLALERDSRQRGKVFEKLNDAPDAVPQNVFKLFPMLEEILDTKILTVFCLYTYRLYSYEVTQETTMKELVERICTDTEIPFNEIYIILPAEQSIERITLETKPIQMFLPNMYDKPMLYCTYLNRTLSDVAPNYSSVIRNVVAKPKEPDWKPFYVMEFAKHALFLIKDERDRYKLFINGLFNYIMYINHDIVKYKTMINRMRREEPQLYGSMEMLKITISHTKEKLDEKSLTQTYIKTVDSWDEQCIHMENKICELKGACDRLSVRYESVLRRSEEAINSPVLKEEFIDERFSITEADIRYNELKSLKMNNCLTSNSHLKMFNLFYKILQELDKLLRASALEHLQKTISHVHEEFRLIQKLVQDALQEILKISTELNRFNYEHHNNLWLIIENNSLPNIPNIDSIFGNLSLSQDGQENMNPLPQACSNAMDVSCFGEGNDAKLLMEEHQKILEATRDLIMDIENDITGE